MFYDKCEIIASNAEVLEMVSEKQLEFSQPFFQIYVPQDKSGLDSGWNAEKTNTLKKPYKVLSKIGAKVPGKKEKAYTFCQIS